MSERLASELLEASRGQGDSVRRKEDQHRMAEAKPRIRALSLVGGRGSTFKAYIMATATITRHNIATIRNIGFIAHIDAREDYGHRASALLCRPYLQDRRSG